MDYSLWQIVVVVVVVVAVVLNYNESTYCNIINIGRLLINYKYKIKRTSIESKTKLGFKCKTPISRISLVALC